MYPPGRSPTSTYAVRPLEIFRISFATPAQQLRLCTMSVQTHVTVSPDEGVLAVARRHSHLVLMR